jgi:hypothetical protein
VRKTSRPRILNTVVTAAVAADSVDGVSVGGSVAESAGWVTVTVAVAISTVSEVVEEVLEVGDGHPCIEKFA